MTVSKNSGQLLTASHRNSSKTMATSSSNFGPTKASCATDTIRSACSAFALETHIGC